MNRLHIARNRSETQKHEVQKQAVFSLIQRFYEEGVMNKVEY
jgi:hypothetical protein